MILSLSQLNLANPERMNDEALAWDATPVTFSYRFPFCFHGLNATFTMLAKMCTKSLGTSFRLERTITNASDLLYPATFGSKKS